MQLRGNCKVIEKAKKRKKNKKRKERCTKQKKDVIMIERRKLFFCAKNWKIKNKQTLLFRKSIASAKTIVKKKI